MKKGSKAGFVLQMIGGIGLALFAIIYIAGVWTELVVYLTAALLFIVFAVLGKKRVWPNVVNLVLSLFPLYGTGLRLGRALYVSIGYGEWYYFTDWYFYLRGLLPFIFCLLGFIGSIIGIKNAVRQKKAEKAAAGAPDGTSSASLPPLKAKLLKKSADTVVRFHNETGEELALGLVDAVYFKENGPMQLFAILQRVGEEKLYVAQYREESDTLSLIDGETAERVLAEWQKELVDTVYFKENGQMQLYAILRQAGKEKYEVVKYREEDGTMIPIGLETAERVLAEWQKGAASSQKNGATSPQRNGAVQRAGGRLKLDLYDTIVYRSDWKAFRKRASQDELFALAVGSRYQLDGVKFYIRSLLGAVGGVLSIVLAFVLAEDFGWFAIIGGVAGYLFFNLMASKQVGYADTLSDCRRKLDREKQQLLKELFPENILLTILRQLVLMVLAIVTFPYKFLLIIIETLIPAARDWTVAHGGEAGAVISLPKGCDIGGLGTMGAYYASQKFGAVWDQHMQEVEAAKLAKFKKYTYTDQYGIEREAYSDDGKTFYDATNKLKEVGISKDDGKTIDLK